MLVYLPHAGKYLTAFSKMERLTSSLRTQLEGCGLYLPVRSGWPRDIEVDSLKFFLKQQQKALEDNKGVFELGIKLYSGFLKVPAQPLNFRNSLLTAS